jgi:hypothetical protein
MRFVVESKQERQWRARPELASVYEPIRRR